MQQLTHWNICDMMIMLNKKPHNFKEHIRTNLDRQWIVGLIIQKKCFTRQIYLTVRQTLKKIYFRLVGLKGEKRLFWCLFFLLEPAWKFPVRIICWEWFPVSTIKDVLVRKPNLSTVKCPLIFTNPLAVVMLGLQWRSSMFMKDGDYLVLQYQSIFIFRQEWHFIILLPHITNLFTVHLFLS